MARITTVHDRFHVGCSACGFSGGHKSFNDAIAAARHASLFKHNTPDEKITIFDLMAHEGAPELWDYEGNILRRKGLKLNGAG